MADCTDLQERVVNLEQQLKEINQKQRQRCCATNSRNDAAYAVGMGFLVYGAVIGVFCVGLPPVGLGVGLIVGTGTLTAGWWKGRCIDPLYLDLYGQGIQTIGVAQGPFFDYEGDGFAEQSGWVSPGGGLLCMDRNGNGIIDNGSELFGGQTPLPNGQLAADGFHALAASDSNHDGKIDAQDPVYSQLRAWVDSNTDGISQPGELFTMPQLGITSIDLDWTTLNTTDAQGNIEMTAGSFQKADGTTGMIAEYTVQINPWHTVPTETLPVPDDIAALPDLPSTGTVYDLHQAMVRDASGRLEALVKEFAAENDPNVRTGLMDQILFQWTGTENIDPNSRGGSIDARKLAVVEAFMGSQWFSTIAYQSNYSDPNPGAAVIIDSMLP